MVFLLWVIFCSLLGCTITISGGVGIYKLVKAYQAASNEDMQIKQATAKLESKIQLCHTMVAAQA